MQNYFKFTFSLRNASNSIKFWNFFLLIFLILLSVISSFENLLIIFASTSGVSAIKILTDQERIPRNGENFWMLFMPIVWAFLLVWYSFSILERALTQFNSWLDEKKF